MTFTIRLATLADWPAIHQIYRDGILTNEATFNTVNDIPDGETWFAGHIAELTFVAETSDGEIAGWASLSPTSKRRVYRGVTEDSVYISEKFKGQGLGSALLGHLVEQSEAAGIWTIIASIFPTNTASIHLHKKFGFRVLGIRKKVAQQHGVWRDVAFLERRSDKVG